MTRVTVNRNGVDMGHLVIGDVLEAITTSLLNRGGTLATLFEPAAAHGRGARQVKGPYIGNHTFSFRKDTELQHD